MTTITSTLNAQYIRNNCSLVDLLDYYGYQPANIRGKDHKYISMLRDTDTVPSLSVNAEFNVWYDYGMGKGGNIIDFGVIFWPNLTFPEVLQKIIAASRGISNDVPEIQRPITRPRLPVKIPHYSIEAVKPLGTSQAIREYLHQRGVWEAAQGRLSEVYYYVEDEKKLRKRFFAAGWPNQNSGWEVRNKYFKGSVGHKGISLIPDDPLKLAVFEGYFNFLSWKQLNPEETHSVVVLNSLALLGPGIHAARPYKTIDLYLDRDKPGEESTQAFITALPSAVDRSAIYHGYNDYNDLLRESRKPALRR